MKRFMTDLTEESYMMADIRKDKQTENGSLIKYVIGATVHVFLSNAFTVLLSEFVETNMSLI